MWPQSPDEILLIRPAAFGYNNQTASTNPFQHRETSFNVDSIYAEVLREFDGLVETYDKAGVKLHVRENGDPLAPDAIFPNSIVTFPPGVFHEKRSVSLHPMLEENRRRERSPEFVSYLKEVHGYEVVLDLSYHEAEKRPLEGTGSLVLDRQNKVIYCSLSGRSNLQVLKEFSAFTGMELMAFNTQDSQGRSIYHTDVMMHIGTSVAGVCPELIVEKDRERVMSRLRQTYTIVELMPSQINHFCGNALEVRNSKGQRFLSCSSRAFEAYSPEQKALYLEHVDEIIHTPVRAVEDIGGGSVRCMTQELF